MATNPVLNASKDVRSSLCLFFLQGLDINSEAHAITAPSDAENAAENNVRNVFADHVIARAGSCALQQTYESKDDMRNLVTAAAYGTLVDMKEEEVPSVFREAYYKAQEIKQEINRQKTEAQKAAAPATEEDVTLEDVTLAQAAKEIAQKAVQFGNSLLGMCERTAKSFFPKKGKEGISPSEEWRNLFTVINGRTKSDHYLDVIASVVSEHLRQKRAKEAKVEKTAGGYGLPHGGKTLADLTAVPPEGQLEGQLVEARHRKDPGSAPRWA